MYDDLKHKKISTRGDLQNVITSVILRQRGIFTKLYIYEGVEIVIRNSIFGKETYKDNVRDMIDDTIHMFWLNDVLKYHSIEDKYSICCSFPSI